VNARIGIDLIRPLAKSNENNEEDEMLNMPPQLPQIPLQRKIHPTTTTSSNKHPKRQLREAEQENIQSQNNLLKPSLKNNKKRKAMHKHTSQQIKRPRTKEPSPTQGKENHPQQYPNPPYNKRKRITHTADQNHYPPPRKKAKVTTPSET
jgi:hypothetical protein